MKKIVINSDNRRFNISSIVVGYSEENKTEKIEFIIPDKYKEFGKKACFNANGKIFAKIFDDINGSTLTFTRDITKYKELEMSIEFFKIENEDEIIARTSNLHIIIENVVICDDDISPDEPKIIILDKLIEEVTKVGLEVEKKGNYAKEQGDYAKSQGDYAKEQKIEVVKANEEANKIINDFETNVSEYTTSFNENANNKTNDFDNNVVSKTSEFNQNVDNKISEYNNNASEKLSTYNTNATSKVNEYNTNASTKLQEYNTNADNKIAEYDAHSEELDNKIVSTRNELERVKNDVLETGTDTDTFVHLEDSAMAEYQELSVDGVCEQETTTGYQLLNLPSGTENGITYSVDEEGYFNFSGTSTSDRITLILDEMPLNGTYTFVSKTVNGFSKTVTLKDNTPTHNNIFLINNNLQTLSNLNVTASQLVIYLDSNVTYKTKLKLMLVSGVEEKDIEPYTGGQPSPSPDFPQPISTIENSLKITSCNKNLWDENWHLGDIGSAGGDYNGSTSSIRTQSYISIKENKKYYVLIPNSTKCFAFYYDKDKKYLKTTTINLNGYKGNATAPTNARYLRIAFTNEYGNTYNNDIIISYEDTPYEQHLETQITANLPEGEFIGKINDTYKDTLKVEYNETDGQYHLKLYKNIGKVVLNGTNNELYGNTSTENYWEYFRTQFKGGINKQNSAKVNYFNQTVNSRVVIIENGTLYLRFPKSSGIDVSTNTKFNEWAKEHNVIVYYVLKDSYEIDLGVVDMPITYNEVTNLFTDSDLLPTINAKYYRNFISTVRNLQVNEKALKQELIDINARLSALESASANVVSESEVIE